jgi:hypothetical protein
MENHVREASHAGSWYTDNCIIIKKKNICPKNIFKFI